MLLQWRLLEFTEGGTACGSDRNLPGAYGLNSPAVKTVLHPALQPAYPQGSFWLLFVILW